VVYGMNRRGASMVRPRAARSCAICDRCDRRVRRGRRGEGVGYNSPFNPTTQLSGHANCPVIRRNWRKRAGV
jgi:hypothetical protein